MTKPTEQEPDRSTPDRTGSAYGTSQPARVWDGAVAGRDESIGDPGTSSDRASSGGASSGGRRPAGDPESDADGASSGSPVDGGSGSASSGRGSDSGSRTGSTDGLTGGANGRTDDAPPRLPPPWERVPAGGAETAATARLGGSGAASGGPSTDRYGSTPRSGATVTEDPDRDSDARDSGSRDAGARRPVSPELGDARTTEVDSRSIWTGQPNPPPGGFPAGWPRNRRPRQANLQLKRLDPWSVLKIALVLAVVLYLVWMVAVGVLYGALDGIGVWDRLNGQYADLVSEGAGDKLISAIRVFGVAAVVGAVNSLLVAVAFSVSAFIYNVSADLVGGIEVTLSERD